MADFEIWESLLRGACRAQDVTFQIREIGTESPDGPRIWKLPVVVQEMGAGGWESMLRSGARIYMVRGRCTGQMQIFLGKGPI